MEILIAASLVTAFLAGLAALFAPCCIGVLLPAYFASIFKNKRTVLLMTIVFFFGLLAVFLPLGLGVGFLGEIFKEYHNVIYVIGGIFLFMLGLSMLLGFHFSLPFSTKSQVKVKGVSSVFVLGIFSGFATLCCAPVLAGALALSILPGSVIWGGIYSIFYVLGMTVPLFIISYFIDKTKVMEKITIFKKEVKYKIFKKEITLTVSNLISGAIFIAMALLIIYFLATNQLMSHSSSGKIEVNLMAAGATGFLISTLEKIPAWAITIFLIFVALLIFWLVKLLIKQWREAKN